MIILENETLELRMLPARGAKIAGLSHRPSGAELLWQPVPAALAGPDGDTPLAPGSPFDATQAWGWDEMFPAINAETFATGDGREIVVPDHGEVWTLPWEVEGTPGRAEATLQVTAPTAAYHLRRRTVLSGGVVRQEYTLRNTSMAPLPWMWAAHPLLRLSAGTRLRAPAALTTVRNALDSPAMPGYDRLFPFPGEDPRLDHCPDPTAGVAHKYFFEEPNTDPEQGLDLELPARGLAVSVRTDPTVAPWFGVWCNAGLLFGHAKIAVEPASAPMDALSAAARLGRLPVLEAGGSVSWWMELRLAPLAP